MKDHVFEHFSIFCPFFPIRIVILTWLFTESGIDSNVRIPLLETDWKFVLNWANTQCKIHRFIHPFSLWRVWSNIGRMTDDEGNDLGLVHYVWKIKEEAKP